MFSARVTTSHNHVVADQISSYLAQNPHVRPTGPCRYKKATNMVTQHNWGRKPPTTITNKFHKGWWLWIVMMTMNCIPVQRNSSVMFELRSSELVGGSNSPCYLTPALFNVLFPWHPLHCRQYPPSCLTERDEALCCLGGTWILVGLRPRKKRNSWEINAGAVRKST